MNTITPPPEKKLSPVRNLYCCCCGAYMRGRQWPNRDTGYGMCDSCITWVRSRGMSEDEIHNLYGVAGVHFGLNAEAQS